MQSTPTSEQIIYGIQLWMLNCLYWDGHNYRWHRHHRAVAPEQRGKIAVAVNRALKHRFAGPGELGDLCHHTRKQRTLLIMPAALGDLRALLPRGATVSTYVISETRTGDGCRMLVFAVIAGEIVPLARTVGELLHWQEYSAQIVVPKPRAQAGAHLVSVLANALHGDPRALRHQSLGEAK